MSNKTVSAFLLIDTNWSRTMITFRKFISGQHATHAYWPCYPVLGIKRDNSHLCCLSEDLNLGFSIYKTFSFQYILWVILDILYQKRLQPLHFTSFGFLFCIKMPPPPLYAYKLTRFSKAFLYFQNPPIHIYFVAPNHLSITTIFFYALSKYHSLLWLKTVFSI